MPNEDSVNTTQLVNSLYPSYYLAEQAWQKAFAVGIERGSTQEEARKLAADAFRQGMPRLIERESVRHFIDCVARGVLLGVFTTQECTRLLYAAQVAISALPKLPQMPQVREKRYNSPYFTADQLNERLNQS